MYFIFWKDNEDSHFESYEDKAWTEKRVTVLRNKELEGLNGEHVLAVVSGQLLEEQEVERVKEIRLAE